MNTPVPNAIETYVVGDLWLTGIVSILLVLGSVVFHYEALSVFTRLLAAPRRRPRIRILYLVLGLTTLHAVEILVFAAAYFILAARGLGELHGMESEHFFYYFYYSGVVYTTLGFGDIIPLGPLKILTAMESLIGLGFITWSASFTFLEMQKYWKTDRA